MHECHSAGYSTEVYRQQVCGKWFEWKNATTSLSLGVLLSLPITQGMMWAADLGIWLLLWCGKREKEKALWFCYSWGIWGTLRHAHSLLLPCFAQGCSSTLGQPSLCKASPLGQVDSMEMSFCGSSLQAAAAWLHSVVCPYLHIVLVSSSYLRKILLHLIQAISSFQFMLMSSHSVPVGAFTKMKITISK